MSITPYYETELGVLYHGDCLEIMPMLESVDMILCDLPYGITACKWDAVIPFKPLWSQYKRMIKDNVAIVLTSSQPFTSMLVMSNPLWFKYSLVWDKIFPTGFLNANRMFMRSHEDIIIFYNKQPTYNPQKVRGQKNHSKKSQASKTNVYGKFTQVDNSEVLGKMKHPKSILTFHKDHPSITLHPTQKPVALFEYLVETYTNKGDMVLDNCLGSGTTAIACERLNRRWIGIEIEEKYCEISAKRIEKERQQLKLF